MATPSIREKAKARLNRGRRDARIVASFIIENTRDNPKTPLQIMKLLYFAHAQTLVDLNRPLFRQNFHVWKYGPVIADVYHALKHHGRDPVVDIIEKYTFTDSTFNEDETDILHDVIEEYGDRTGFELSALTHWPEGPWHQIRVRRGIGYRIPNHIIRRYYLQLLFDAA